MGILLDYSFGSVLSYHQYFDNVPDGLVLLDQLVEVTGEQAVRVGNLFGSHLWKYETFS